MTRARTDSAPPVLHRGIGVPTKCRSCTAEIAFALAAGGRKTPFVKDDEGLYIFENGAARLAGGRAPRQLQLGEVPLQRYSIHTCPDASPRKGS